jgi:PIN domain nuclease of toxin-antitoxin system
VVVCRCPGTLEEGAQNHFRGGLLCEFGERVGDRHQGEPGKLKLPSGLDRYIPEQIALNGFSSLEIGFRHIASCADLPWHRRDPFDRLLVAQALKENLRVVSRDAVFERYGVKRIW